MHQPDKGEVDMKTMTIGFMAQRTLVATARLVLGIDKEF